MTAGRTLASRYVLRRVLANGGMAQVWVADDLILDRPVAVKILHAHLADDDGFVRRFRAEAVAAARLTHPGIVATFDTVSEPGVEAIVMELIEGATLREHLDQNGPMDLTQTAAVITGVAEALHAAHQSGVVHRDVKPANILLCAEQRVKVADFGIAKAMDGAGEHTQTGTLLGTAKYLSPEQVDGTELDARSDLYSLAVVAYECLCGRPPFDEGNDTATALARVRRDPPPVGTFVPPTRPQLPRQLDDIFGRALARQPDMRQRDVLAFAEDLSAIAPPAQEPPPPPPTPYRRARPIWLAPLGPGNHRDHHGAEPHRGGANTCTARRRANTNAISTHAPAPFSRGSAHHLGHRRCYRRARDRAHQRDRHRTRFLRQGAGQDYR